MTTPSTPALSISASSSSLPSGARCGSARAGHGRSGVLAPQIWTCASTIFIGFSLCRSAGRRSRHGAARSSWAASENSISSAPKRPTKCRPIGRPSSVQASGTDMAGTPVALHTAVNGIIGASPCWYCSSVPSIRTVPSGRCVRAMVGDSSTSCFSKNGPSWRPVRWKVCTARMYSSALMPWPTSAWSRVTGSRSSGPGTRPAARTWMLVKVLAHITVPKAASGCRGIVVGRRLLDMVAELFQQLRRALDGGDQHGIERLAAHGLAHEGDAQPARRTLRRRQEGAGAAARDRDRRARRRPSRRATPRCRARRSTRNAARPRRPGSRRSAPGSSGRATASARTGRTATPGCGSSRRRRWHAPSAGRAPRRPPPNRPTIRRARGRCARDFWWRRRKPARWSAPAPARWCWCGRRSPGRRGACARPPRCRSRRPAPWRRIASPASSGVPAQSAINCLMT